MNRAAATICIVFIPILFVLGMFRILIYNGQVDFLPSYESLFETFASFPNVIEGVQDALGRFRDLNVKLGEIEDSLGNFSWVMPVVTMWSYGFNIVLVLFQVILVPFRVLWWLIFGLFGFTFKEIDTAVVEEAQLRMMEIRGILAANGF